MINHYVYVAAYAPKTDLSLISFVSAEVLATNEGQAYDLGFYLVTIPLDHIRLNDYVHQVGVTL